MRVSIVVVGAVAGLLACTGVLGVAPAPPPEVGLGRGEAVGTVWIFLFLFLGQSLCVTLECVLEPQAHW